MKKTFLTALLFVSCSAFLSAQSSYVLQDFEDISVVLDQAGSDGTFFNWNNGFALVEVAENPLVDGINTSKKVAKVNLTGSTSKPNDKMPTSTIIRISFSSGHKPQISYPENEDSQQAGKIYYDRLRFKYYSNGVGNKYIAFAPNSNSNKEEIIPAEKGHDKKWVYVDIPLTEPYYKNFMIRLNRDSSGGTAARTKTGDVVYIDDFELYNSKVGPTINK